MIAPAPRLVSQTRHLLLEWHMLAVENSSYSLILVMEAVDTKAHPVQLECAVK